MTADDERKVSPHADDCLTWLTASRGHVFANSLGQWIAGGTIAGAWFGVALVYHFIRCNPASCFTANKCLGIGAVVTIATALALGPLVRLGGKRFVGWLPLRRPLGVLGAALTAPHIALSLFWFPEKFPLAWYGAHWASVVLAVLAEVLCVTLVVYSWPRGVRQLGPVRWRRLHQLGWLALGLSLGHVLLLGKAPGWIKWFETFDRYLPPGALATSAVIALALLLKGLDVVVTVARNSET